MDDKIFRKAAVERLSSPEHLDQVMRVVPARGWIALVCLFVMVAAAIVWACLGQIARLAEGRGAVLLGEAGFAGDAVAVVAAEDGAHVRAGMDAQITLDSGAVLTGKVVSVSGADGQAPYAGGIRITGEAFPGWISSPGDAAVLLRVDAGQAQAAAQALAQERAQPIGNASGWFCAVRITIGQFPPIQMILP